MLDEVESLEEETKLESLLVTKSLSFSDYVVTIMGRHIGASCLVAEITDVDECWLIISKGTFSVPS